MMKLVLAFGVAAICSLPAPSAFAAKATTYGPYDDGSVTIPLDDTDFGFHTYNNAGQVVDFVQVNPCPACTFQYPNARAVQYLTSTTGGIVKGTLLVTTIYGVDLDPNGNSLAMTGYTASAPEVTYSGDELIGKSRKVYPSNGPEIIAISDLAARLGSGFDLSIFQGDPSSVVFLFQTKFPAKDRGTPATGIILDEDLSGAFHFGYNDAGGSYDPGEIAGTQLVVTGGNVDILGVLNGRPKGTCMANPQGNCLDLIGDMGFGAVRSLESYTLDPKYTYTIEFTVDTGGLGSDVTLDFLATLGAFSQKVTATSVSQKFDLYYTPTSSEANATVGFMSQTKVDDTHGPVLSSIKFCAHPVKTKDKRCSV